MSKRNPWYTSTQREETMSKRNPWYFQVRPRYTPGSPGQVPAHIAEKVVQQEREAHAQTLTGVYGDAEKRRAETVGLAGVVEKIRERRRAWEVCDLITGETFERPFRWKNGTRVQVYLSDEAGWVEGRVAEGSKTDHEAKVFIPDLSPWAEALPGLPHPDAIRVVRAWQVRPAEVATC